MTIVVRLSLTLAAIAVAHWACELSLEAQELAGARDVKAAFKRRDSSSEEELRQQLQRVPEVGFGQIGAAYMNEFLRNGAQVQLRSRTTVASPPPDLGFRYYKQWARRHRRADMVALPWRQGVDCQIGKEAAEWLQSCSVNLRACLQSSGGANGVGLTDAAQLKSQLIRSSLPGQQPSPWTRPDCVPTLVQMLQAENAAVRALLVEMLANIDGKAASVALAQRAVFDLSPDVRAQAVEALQPRPRHEFQTILLAGLRWPWKPAADHAAEAIVALEMKELVPDLVAMLNEPDPALPFAKEVHGTKGTFVRELVQLNHFHNCTLCHAHSVSSQDLVRGLIPTPGQALAPVYYAAATGQFVRADTTFLRQDFSVVQPVDNPGPWPGHQRFDYLLRERRASALEIKQFLARQKDSTSPPAYSQRDAVLFALRKLTEQDGGAIPADWLVQHFPFDFPHLGMRFAPHP
jgi:hypothetical protein